MKIYDYAKSRNIKSKDVVKKLHEMGFLFVKNHLSLVPEKILDDLDRTEFPKLNSEKKFNKESTAFIAMECAPFINYGTGIKVKNKIDRCHGDRKIVIIPRKNIKVEVELFCELTVYVNQNIKTAKVYKYLDHMTEYYFIENDHFFHRDKLFGYAEDSERIAFFNKAAIELFKFLNYPFDKINIHDWPLGLFPLLFEELLRTDYQKTTIEFSIYGSTYQGIYGVEVLLNEFNLDRKFFDEKIVEHANSINLLKAGLVTAKKIDMDQLALNDLKNSYLRSYVYDNM